MPSTAPRYGSGSPGWPNRVAGQLRQILDAGADSIGLWLFPPERVNAQLRRVAADVLPAIG